LRVEIFDRVEQCTDDEVSRMLPLVSLQRREQALRFKFTAGRYACLKSYLMLRELLTDLALLPSDEHLIFDYGPHGKPFIKDHPDIHFNISHCPKAIAVAVAEHPVGIDVERFHTPTEPLLQRTMNPAERHAITTSPDPAETFSLLWTQKEALLKFRGTGIIDDLTNILDNPSHQIQSHVNAEKQYVWSLIF